MRLPRKLRSFAKRNSAKHPRPDWSARVSGDATYGTAAGVIFEDGSIVRCADEPPIGRNSIHIGGVQS